MQWQEDLTNDPEKRYNFTRRQKNLMNVLHRPVEVAVAKQPFDNSRIIADPMRPVGNFTRQFATRECPG